MNVVILAAGKGVRMQSMRPKVLHLLAGEPLLAHVLRTARAIGVEKTIVVYGHGGDEVKRAFEKDDKVIWVEQSPQSGTGDAVMRAIPFLNVNQPTLVLYGDVPLLQPASLFRLREATQKLAVLTVILPHPFGYGRIVRDRSGRIMKIVEEKDASLEEKKIAEVNTGILLADTPRLISWLKQLKPTNQQNEYYLTDIISLAAQEIDIQTLQVADVYEVMGINTQAQRVELERYYQQRLANDLLQQGVQLSDSNRLDIRGQLICGSDVSIDIGCVFEGAVELADGVDVGPYCVIKNARIGAGTRIEAYSMLNDVVIGDQAVVGPYARLRPGTVLGDEVRIGNFVEVKNSQIAGASKVNHLSYIGDAQVGQRVNIGAGTITCNYDGINKYPTKIKDDAFIGSGTQLVAPIVVSEGATIGAGTTLTRDAPAHALTLSRTPQKSLEKWRRHKKSI